jgi:hypothetical protein
VTRAIFDHPPAPVRSTAGAPAAWSFFGSSGRADGLTRALQAAAGAARYTGPGTSHWA